MIRSLAVVALLSSTARADSGDHDRQQVIVADAIVDGIGLSVVIPHMPGKLVALLFWGSILGQAVTPPIIHTANQDYGRAAIDLGVRIAMPTAGFFLGLTLCDKLTKQKHDVELLRCFGGAALGGLIGVLGGQVIDWTLISRPSGATTDPNVTFKLGFAF